MFDIIGIFDFNSVDPPVLSRDSLPASKYLRAAAEIQSINGKGLSAVCASHPINYPSYFSKDGTHLFIVGEVRLRSDANTPGLSLRPENCPLVPAEALYALYRTDPVRFICQVKGNFSIIVADEREREVSIWNSRFGISPFYYAVDGKRFIFSTGLVTIGRNLSREPSLDLAAVGELALFNYPLGDRTYFQQVKILRPAEKIVAQSTGLRLEYYWDIMKLYDSKVSCQNEALEIGASLFSKTVDDMVTHVPCICVSFTSGFDSRALMSVLNREASGLLSYSFGIISSLNVSVPETICGQLGIPFQPIYLEREYEKVFNRYAWKALELSDGLSTIERANYPYAFEKLGCFSSVVISGLFGSELMRTFQNVGSIVSSNLVAINSAGDMLREFRRICLGQEIGSYFFPLLSKNAIEEVETDIQSVLVERFGHVDSDQRFYMFLLTEGLRKYFGAEVHMERPWGINRFPFLDDEFVEFAFRSPFAGVHARTIKPTIMNRFNSQYFYSYVIRKYRPELLNYPTDHGYSPGDVISPLGLFRIAPKFLYWRNRRKRKGYREFRTEEWTETFYQKYLFDRTDRDDLFSADLKADFISGKWKMRRLDFARAASLKLYVDRVMRVS